MSGLHDHAEEIEKSRSPRSSARRSNSNLGPLKTPGRGTPPGGETSRPVSAPSMGEELPDDIPKVSKECFLSDSNCTIFDSVRLLHT